MFGAACKGLHCACCKTFGGGPVLILLILYVIGTANESAIVRVLLEFAEILTFVAAIVGFLVGVCYAILTRATRGHIRVDTGRPSYEVHHARYRASEAASDRMALPAVSNHSRIPVLYRPPDEARKEGQFVVLERRDER